MKRYELLKQYYDEYFFKYTDIPFTYVPVDQKLELMRSHSFAIWMISYHLKVCAIDLQKAFSRLGMTAKGVGESVKMFSELSEKIKV